MRNGRTTPTRVCLLTINDYDDQINKFVYVHYLYMGYFQVYSLTHHTIKFYKIFLTCIKSFQITVTIRQISFFLFFLSVFLTIFFFFLSFFLQAHWLPIRN